MENSHWKKTLEFVFIVCALVLCKGCVDGSKVLENRTFAEKQCRDEGGLASFDHFTAGISASRITMILSDSESAWISGYAVFSSFIAWHGCFKTNKHGRMIKMEDNSINMCIEHCRKDDVNHVNKTKYIGITSAYCHCFSVNDRNTKLNPQWDSECIIDDCKYSVLFGYSKCAKKDHVGLFTLDTIKTPKLQWSDGEPSARQCVYVKKGYDGNLSMGTSSCYTTGDPLIDGHVCTHSVAGVLSSQCSMSDRYICLENRSSSWQVSNNRCMLLNGKLAGGNLARFFSSHMRTSEMLWFGAFRTFITSKTKPVGNHTACLSVIRVGDRLLMEPDDCTNLKYSICQNDISQTTATTNTFRIDQAYTMVTRTANVMDKASPNTSVPQYLYPVVGAVGGVLLMTIAVVCIAMRRRRIPQSTRKPKVFKDCESDVANNENHMNEMNEAHQHEVPAENGMALARKSTILTPNKPVRQTIKRKTASVYENFKIGKSTSSKRLKNGKDQQSTDYDKINLRQTNAKFVNVDRMDDIHVYDHTTTTEDGNYDTMKSVKSVHSTGNADQLYNRLESSKSQDDTEFHKMSLQHGAAENSSNNTIIELVEQQGRENIEENTYYDNAVSDGKGNDIKITESNIVEQVYSAVAKTFPEDSSNVYSEVDETEDKKTMDLSQDNAVVMGELHGHTHTDDKPDLPSDDIEDTETYSEICLGDK